MSTGLECEIIEWELGKWYYVLERGNAPKQSWDWREYADAYGPYPDEEAAFKGLCNNHANPGGHSSMEYSPERSKDKMLAGLIAKAKRMQGGSIFSRGYGRGL